MSRAGNGAGIWTGSRAGNSMDEHENTEEPKP
jgi:hypothetical protein